MPSFKPKTTKKIIVDQKSTVTLDSKHSEFLEEFEKDSDTVNELGEEKQKLIDKLHKSHVHKGGARLEQHLERKDRLKDITTKVKKLKKKRVNYLLDNSKYVFGYFENKKSIAEGEEDHKNV